MRASGTSRRPLARGIMHVASSCRRLRDPGGAAGYWGIVRAPDLVRSPYDPAVIAAARTVPRGQILDRDGKVLARNKKDANGEHYRVYASHGDQPRRRLRLAPLRHGRASSGRSTRSWPVWPATRWPTRSASSGPTPYDPKDLTLSLSYDLQRAAVRALGKDRGAIVMLDPRTGEVLALASTPDVRRLGHRRPGDGRRDVRGAHRRQGPAAAPARDPGPVRAGLGVQDRDGGRGPRVGRGHPGDDVQGAAQGREERPARRRLPGPRRPPPADRQRRRSTSSRRPRCRATSGTR